MKITKLGHCCLGIEEKEVRLLTDPGTFSSSQNEIKNLDAILITHEHADHFHIDSLKMVLQNNPQAIVITNKAVGALLDKENISYTLVEHGESLVIKNVLIEGFGERHADIYKTITPVENTGYFISNTLFYPGDAFTDPQKPVDILALPVAGPWMKISEAIEYALMVKPRIAFPVHDGVLAPQSRVGLSQRLPNMILSQEGIEFIGLNDGESFER